MLRLSASFFTMVDAHHALDALKDIGIQNVYLDAIDRFHEEFSTELGITAVDVGPMTQRLVLKSMGHTGSGRRSYSPQNIEASRTPGLHDDSFPSSTRLIIETDEAHTEQIKSIVANMGGNLQE